MTKKKHFPNNWKAYKDSPDEFFIPLSFNEFYNWKVMGWALPSSIKCIIREEKDGKISEKVYSQSKSARKYLEKQMSVPNQNTIYTICDDSAVQVLYPRKQHDIFKDYEDMEMADIWDDEDLFGEEL